MAQNRIYENKILWEADALYSHHRIPGAVVTERGTLIVYCEARTACSDWALMDILMQRSTDGGISFEPPIWLCEGAIRHNTVNNPVMIVGQGGVLHLLYCVDYTVRGGGIYYRRSTDDGLTWSVPRDLSMACRPEFHQVLAPGPGHGLCLQNGVLIGAGPVRQLCRAVEGCVIEEDLDPAAFAAVSAGGRVVSFQPLGDHYRVRYLLEAPAAAPRNTVTPTLEDVYLYHFHDSE